MKSKLALVTGVSTNNIGNGIVKKFLIEGYSVVAVYRSSLDDPQRLEDFYKQFTLYKDKIVLKRADLGNKQSILGLIEQLKSYIFDVIVNCAGTLSFNGDKVKHEFYDFDYDSFNMVLQSNLTSMYAISVGLKDNIVKEGLIVNISSGAAEEGALATISYNASKAAIKNITKSLALNFGGYNGVRVNSVAPGWIPSNLADKRIVDIAKELTPVKVFGTPDDVANAVFDFVGKPYVSGENYDLNGGLANNYLMYIIESLDARNIPIDDIAESLKSLIKTARTNLDKRDRE